VIKDDKKTFQLSVNTIMNFNLRMSLMMMIMMMMMIIDNAVASSEVRALYPNKFIQYDEQRIYILNTLFNLPGLMRRRFLFVNNNNNWAEKITKIIYRGLKK